MNSPVILMAVASPGRDLESSALVGYHLERRYGHKVIYCGWRSVAEGIIKHAPAAVVLDRPRTNVMRLAARLGSGIAILPTVGYYQDPELFQRRWLVENKEIADAIDCYFTWEEDSRTALLQNGLLAPAKIQTVGCTRFDFCSPKYHSLMEAKESLLVRLGFRSPDRPLIVWGTATFFRRTRDHGPDWRVSQTISEADRRELADEATTYSKISDCISTLAKKRLEWNFLIKVHPSELSQPYQRLFAGFPNVKVAYDVPLRTVLHHCDVLVQRGSTSATEAWILGKPVMEATFGNYNVEITAEMLSGNEMVTSTSEAEAFFCRCLEGDGISLAQSRARQEFLRRTYSLLDGAASERCAQLIEEQIARPRLSKLAKIRAAARKEAARRLHEEDRRVVNRVKDLFGLDRSRSLRFWRSFGAAKKQLDTCDQPLTEEMIATHYERFAAALANDVFDESGLRRSSCLV